MLKYQAAAAAVLCVGLWTVSAQSATCPAPKGGLTLDGVMQNFGTAFLDADNAVSDGIADASSVTNSEIQSGIQGIQLAEACAQDVLSSTSPDMQPDKAQTLSGTAKDQYLQKFHTLMSAFLASLVDYEKALTTELALPAAKRSFIAAQTAGQAVRDRANDAHSQLQ